MTTSTHDRIMKRVIALVPDAVNDGVEGGMVQGVSLGNSLKPPIYVIPLASRPVECNLVLIAIPSAPKIESLAKHSERSTEGPLANADVRFPKTVADGFARLHPPQQRHFSFPLSI
jgi:hypothetical protein